MNIYKNLDQIAESFIIFDDPLDKYTQLIDFGKQAKGLPKADRTDVNKIRGCVSEAWVVVNVNKNNSVKIQTDSNSFIVKGLLSILDQILYNVNIEDVLMLEAHRILETLALKESITSQRTNGFLNALKTIKKQIQVYE